MIWCEAVKVKKIIKWTVEKKSPASYFDSCSLREEIKLDLKYNVN